MCVPIGINLRKAQQTLEMGGLSFSCIETTVGTQNQAQGGEQSVELRRFRPKGNLYGAKTCGVEKLRLVYHLLLCFTTLIFDVFASIRIAPDEKVLQIALLRQQLRVVLVVCTSVRI